MVLSSRHVLIDGVTGGKVAAQMQQAQNGISRRFRASAADGARSSSRDLRMNRELSGDPKFRQLEPGGQLVAATGGHSSSRLTADDGPTDIP